MDTQFDGIRRITHSQASRIGGNNGFNGNGGNEQIPPVVLPVQVRRNYGQGNETKNRNTERGWQHLYHREIRTRSTNYHQ